MTTQQPENPDPPQENPQPPKPSTFTLEKLANLTDTLIKIALFTAGASALLGWFIHGVWAERMGIQTNQAWNFQYIVAGMIPAYMVTATLLNTYFFARYIFEITAAFRNPRLTTSQKKLIYSKIDTNHLGPLSITYCITIISLFLISIYIDPKIKFADLYQIYANPITWLTKVDSTSSSYVFNTWLLAPFSFSLFIYVSIIFLISVILTKKSSILKILLAIFTLLFAYSMFDAIRNLKLQDYYETLPKQLGGAKPSRVTLILEGGPEELYPSGKPDDSNRTQPLNLIYINQDFYVVKIPGKPEVYQLSKDQVKSIISSAPKPLQENKKSK